MRLERLTVQGFKSFAERLEFIFEPGITAIVGPNGSGKSNVVDAIRWALGEQSLHSLRGERLEDIIFNGSGFRRPHGLAEVGLTFNNESGLLPLPYSEVTVMRRAYRSGNSEFLLNGVPCRLRDIQDLFADTGIGKDGYAFIGQGKVDEVLNLSPLQRRMFLEQAAGAWKWRRRKKEAEDKLAYTEQDLVRLRDVCAELERQREPLVEEARRAGAYRTKSNRLRELQIFVGLSEIRRLEERIASVQEKLVPEQQRTQELGQRRSTLEVELERRRADIAAHEIYFGDLKSRENRVQQQLVALEKQLTSLLGEARERAVRQEAVLNQGQELAGRCSELRQQQAQSQEELAQLAAVLTTKEESLALLNTQLQELEREHNQIQGRTSQRRERIIDCLSERSAHSNALRSLAREQQVLEERRGRAWTAAEEAGTRAEAVVQLQTKEDERITTLTEQGEALESKRAQLEGQIAVVCEQEKMAQREYDAARRTLERSEAELAGLQSLQRNFSSYYQGPRSVLTARCPGIVGAVAQLMVVPAEYEIAIETALGTAQQFLVADSDEAAAAAIDWLRSTGGGRATFLPLNTIRPWTRSVQEQELVKLKGAVGWADELVQFPAAVAPAIKYLLGRVLVARDLTAARAIAKAGGFQLKTVTLAGDVVNPGGSLAGGSLNKRRPSQISLGRQLRELKQKVAQQESKLAERQKILTATGERRQRLESELGQMMDRARQMEDELTMARSKKKEYAAQLTETRHNRVVWEEEEKILTGKLQELLAEKERRLQSEQIAEKNLQQWETVATQEEKHQQDLAEQIEKIQQEALALRLDLVACQEKEKQLKLRSQEQRLSLEQLERQQAEVRRKLEEIDSLAAAGRKAQQELQTRQLALTTKSARITDEVQQTGEILSGLRCSLKDDDRELLQLLKTEENQRSKVHTLELTLGRLEADREGAQRHLFETQVVPTNYSLPSLDLKLSEAQAEIERLKDEITALGDVNLKAPQTLAEINERHGFLSSQAQDVESARETLLELISDIDQTVATRLLKTFELLRNNFRDIFQHLFRGGQADLRLTSDDPNEAGLEIFAQLPDKKMQPLMSLSGGERALTAIAFLFALLRCGQSSVCVLDEIDASLDETNAERFLSYLEELAAETQFIIVTHKRQAMIRAQALYGLTMAPSGTSSLVSVDLTQAAG